MNGVVLLTGASGSLGQTVLAELREAGWLVRALAHRAVVSNADESTRGDLLDRSSLARAAHGVAAVVHLAAVTHARTRWRYQATNVNGTSNLVRAAVAAGVPRFIHVSTRAIAESGGAYSRSKREAERLVRESSLATTIVRLPEVYGGGGTEGIDRIIANIQAGSRIFVIGAGSDELRPIHAADAARAIVSALTSEAAIGKTYTLAGPEVTISEFIAVCAIDRGVRAKVTHVPASVVRLLSAAARVLPLPLYPDQLARLRAPKPPPSSDARVDLNFEPRSVADGLRALSGR